jgi:hypothetical protein
MEEAMATIRLVPFTLAAALALAGGASLAQQGQTVVDQPQQTPNRAAIPEKMGPSIESKKPTTPEEKAAPGNEGRQLPESRHLEMKDAVPNTGGTSVPPSKPEAQ